MNVSASSATGATPLGALAAGHAPGWPTTRRMRWHAIEDGGLALLLGVMIALPLAEIVLRQFSVGIPSAPDFLRHLTLLVGMAGGALAAREGRLLALASSATLFRGRGQVDVLVEPA